MSQIVGIDLGTTNSLIGIMDSGFPILLADSEGSRLTPSTVHFPVSGEPLVGQPAGRMKAVSPERTVFSVKRLMGARPGETGKDSFPFQVVDVQGKTSIVVGDRTVTPEEVSSIILRKLKAARSTEFDLGLAPVDRKLLVEMTGLIERVIAQLEAPRPGVRRHSRSPKRNEVKR